VLNVALTGNIAAGKSTVLSLFHRWGATVIDADELAHEAQAPGTPVLHAIVRRFGEDVLLPDGALDRAALRAKVMEDEAALAALNALVHPAVARRRESLLDAAWKRGDRIVVNDIPLLFEVLDPDQFDVIILVDAPPPIRQARLEGLRGLSRSEAAAMLAAQMPADRKRLHSDLVIENDGSLEDLEHRARVVYDELERRAQAKEHA
jgi:dephospho-CoA kinase